MLFYIRCPTCGSIISQNIGKYYDELELIREDHNMKKEDKEEKAAKLLDKYNIRKICCRIRVITTPPYHKIVVT